jgi:hypothetical protein
MNQVESLQCLGNAESLKSVQSVDLAQWGWGSSGKTVPATVPLDPKVRSQAIADAFQEAVSTNPELLNKTVADAARFMKVPPTALQAAFNQLAAQTGVKLADDGGNPRTMQAILSDVPASQGNKLLDGWVKSLPPAVQQTLFGVAVGVALATGGVRGLAERFQLQANLIKSPQGQLVLSLVPSQKSNGVAGQLSGEVRVPINEKGQVEVKGQVRTDGSAQFAAGLKMALGSSTFSLEGTTVNQPLGSLSAKVAIPLDSRTKLDLGVSGLNAPLGVQAGVSGQGWSVKGQIDTSGGYLLQGQLQYNL